MTTYKVKNGFSYALGAYIITLGALMTIGLYHSYETRARQSFQNPVSEERSASNLEARLNQWRKVLSKP